jgi:hypothetical protein
MGGVTSHPTRFLHAERECVPAHDARCTSATTAVPAYRTHRTARGARRFCVALQRGPTYSKHMAGAIRVSVAWLSSCGHAGEYMRKDPWQGLWVHCSFFASYISMLFLHAMCGQAAFNLTPAAGMD